MNNVDKQYKDFLRHILKNGNVKKDRTGTGTISIFDYSMRFNMSEGFPLLTSKKLFPKSIITELLWFLNGDTNIKYLNDNNCTIWNGDAYKAYVNKTKESLNREDFISKIRTDEEFSKLYGDLGPVYGKQWRDVNNIDQIDDLIHDLNNNPDSRRLMVSAWNVSELGKMCLPPCHFAFQCYTSELTHQQRLDYLDKSINIGDITSEKLDELNIPKRKLDLKWYQRSCDAFLGIPYNIASYAFLLHLLAREVNMIPNDLIFTGGDCHIYLNHIDAVNTQLEQDSYDLPKLELTNSSIYEINYEDFNIINYKSSAVIKAELSN